MSSPRKKWATDGDGNVALGMRVVSVERNENWFAVSGWRRSRWEMTFGTGIPLFFSPVNCVKVKLLSYLSLLKPFADSNNRSRHDERRSSPSLIDCKPTRSCMATASRMHWSSTRRSSSPGNLPAVHSPRAAIRCGGRSRLPT